MTFVATLTPNPRAPALDAAAIERARRALASAESPIWLDLGIAADIPFTGGRENTQAAKTQALTEHGRAARARGARGPASRRAAAACERPAQAAFSCRHGFHHDRAGMYRRTRGL